MQDVEDQDPETPIAADQNKQQPQEQPSGMFFMGLGFAAGSPLSGHRGAGKEGAAKSALMQRLGPHWGEALQEVSEALGCLGLEAASEEAYTLVLHR